MARALCEGAPPNACEEGARAAGWSTEELVDEILDRKLQIARNGSKDASERPDTKIVEIGYGDVVLDPAGGRHQSHVATGLSPDLVAEAPQTAGEVAPRDVAGNLQAGRTSSRTQCSRMTRGA